MPVAWAAGRDKPVPYGRCSQHVGAPGSNSHGTNRQPFEFRGFVGATLVVARAGTCRLPGQRDGTSPSPTVVVPCASWRGQGVADKDSRTHAISDPSGCRTFAPIRPSSALLSERADTRSRITGFADVCIYGSSAILARGGTGRSWSGGLGPTEGVGACRACTTRYVNQGRSPDCERSAAARHDHGNREGLALHVTGTGVTQDGERRSPAL